MQSASCSASVVSALLEERRDVGRTADTRSLEFKLSTSCGLEGVDSCRQIRVDQAINSRAHEWRDSPQRGLQCDSSRTPAVEHEIALSVETANRFLRMTTHIGEHRLWVVEQALHSVECGAVGGKGDVNQSARSYLGH